MPMTIQYRELLISIYLDWYNNYALVETFAEHNGLTKEQGEALINLARQVYNSDHPDA